MDTSRGKTLVVGAIGLNQSQIPPHAAGPFDPRTLFATPTNAFEIEIGSGKGTFLVQQAVRQTETNFLGIEWTAEFWRYAADRIRRRELSNVKLLHTDATEFFRFWLPDQIAGVIHLYFSDPWPKTRHHKRRVIQDETLPHFHRVLAVGGELRLVTDHVDLWKWYQDHAARHANLFAIKPFVSPDSAGLGEVVGTNFERKFARQGRPFMAMTLVKLELPVAPDSSLASTVSPS
ncbi:MAG: tRNA (guanosine(46)-N7)-methyltransferase TrmB [Phycisphaerales bacterium]|nr:tRNA (guanosine(46)-N7)-methyltransferase TrmB [Phycisphaerales bacterium]